MRFTAVSRNLFRVGFGCDEGFWKVGICNRMFFIAEPGKMLRAAADPVLL